MADEDEIRELIGRMSAAQRQGFHVPPGGIRVVLTALRFFLAAKIWLTKPRGDPHDDPPRKPTEKFNGPPATIGGLRGLGLVACTISCAGSNCGNERRVTFESLGLPDETPIPSIPTRRSFRCSRCGLRRVRITPDWTEHQAQGNGRERSD